MSSLFLFDIATSPPSSFAETGDTSGLQFCSRGGDKLYKLEPFSVEHKGTNEVS